MNMGKFDLQAYEIIPYSREKAYARACYMGGKSAETT